MSQSENCGFIFVRSINGIGVTNYRRDPADLRLHHFLNASSAPFLLSDITCRKPSPVCMITTRAKSRGFHLARKRFSRAKTGDAAIVLNLASDCRHSLLEYDEVISQGFFIRSCSRYFRSGIGLRTAVGSSRGYCGSKCSFCFKIQF